MESLNLLTKYNNQTFLISFSISCDICYIFLCVQLKYMFNIFIFGSWQFLNLAFDDTDWIFILHPNRTLQIQVKVYQKINYKHILYNAIWFLYKACLSTIGMGNHYGTKYCSFSKWVQKGFNPVQIIRPPSNFSLCSQHGLSYWSKPVSPAVSCDTCL